MTMEQQQPVDR
ncbi:hypothetical protein CGLO_10593 [Colletotrichum gloeosporioides Cg-14]|uniref:Uncharacterized protein n=1 Tax=Colletotrichum gloeosporioides (strain Cg-14) TaxID=1237896 RepID=T0KAB4_COLGC|nr:hypothetical protein CGLO_10593 [Colletotrichum gloeosporioides Cg-14]